MPARADFLRAMREVTAKHGILPDLRRGDLASAWAITARRAFSASSPTSPASARSSAAGFRRRGRRPRRGDGGLRPARRQAAVPHGGTFNANPVTMAAGLAAMRLMDESAFTRIDEMGETLRSGFGPAWSARGCPAPSPGWAPCSAFTRATRSFVDYRSAAATAPRRSDSPASTARSSTTASSSRPRAWVSLDRGHRGGDRVLPRSAERVHHQRRVRMRRPLLAFTSPGARRVSVGAPDSAHAQKSFKVGAIVPVSGPAAAFGLGCQRGLELAAETRGLHRGG